MDENMFEVDGENGNSLIVHLLIMIASDQKAILSFLVDEDFQKRDGSFDKTTAALDDAREFYKGQILKSLYVRFASLKDLLPPQVDPGEG